MKNKEDEKVNNSPQDSFRYLEVDKVGIHSFGISGTELRARSCNLHGRVTKPGLRISKFYYKNTVVSREKNAIGSTRK